MDNVIYNVSADIIFWPLVANCESLTEKSSLFANSYVSSKGKSDCVHLKVAS